MFRHKYFLCITLFRLISLLPLIPALPDPDPAQSFLPKPSPSATTIPAFPEQSDVSGCPLDLPQDLFASVKSACSGKHGSGQLRRSRCCPVLGAWLYSAYSATALGKAIKAPTQTASYYDLPLLPDDSETCVDNLEKGLSAKGIELVRLNDTCDVVYCECGIRLHPLTCTNAFSVDSGGHLVGNNKVKRLERDCLNNVAVNGFAGLNGCSKCLKSLHLLNKDNGNLSISSEERSSKMQKKDCELMGLTWLLAKNRSAYIHTVSAVLRATMMSNSVPQSCTLNSDGMPLAVDSSQINESSSLLTMIRSPLCLSILSLFIFYVSVSVSIHQLLDYTI